MNNIVGDISMNTPTKEFLASIGNISCTNSFAVVSIYWFSVLLFVTEVVDFSYKLQQLCFLHIEFEIWLSCMTSRN
jgi:hypothetical protein